MQKKYIVDDIIECYVTGIEKYGIFVNVDNDYNGLIHISEIADGFVQDINDYVKIGEKIYCQILEIDNKNNQMKLSIKNINYKNEKNIGENIRGFLPLKEKLEKWIDEKLDEYNSK